jgi:hypothetical protein
MQRVEDSEEIIERVAASDVGKGEGAAAADVGEGEGRLAGGVLEAVTGRAHRAARVLVP